MLNGSAPIASDVLDLLKVAFCCNVLEGYGMTETGAGTIISNFNDPVSGHIGGPLANVKVKLKDIPEMGYFASEGNVAANKPP